MNCRRLIVALAVVFAGGAVSHASVPALAAGESLTYSVDWAIVTAGEIRIAADPASPGLRVTTTTRTNGPLRWFFDFEAKGESLFEMPSGRLLSTMDTSKSDRKQTRSTVRFDYAKAQAQYTDEVEPARSVLLPMPPGDPLDLIMSLIQTRSWGLKPGESRDALVIFEGEFYELTVHALGYEEIRTPLGRFNTLVLEPRMDKGPPKGMFKRGSTVRVWISEDERRLPVRFRVDFKIGSGTANLIGHTLKP